jgi:hypothetical protein
MIISLKLILIETRCNFDVTLRVKFIIIHPNDFEKTIENDVVFCGLVE